MGVVGSEAARSGDAVDVGMMLEPLVPGVEHAEEADLRAEVVGIASDLQQGGGAGLKEQAVDDALVLKREGSEFARQGEDEMHGAGGQQFPFACLEPARRLLRLPWGKVRVGAELLGDGGVCPQAEQRSRWPPRAAVRQRVIASRTFWCCHVIQRRLTSMKPCPA